MGASPEGDPSLKAVRRIEKARESNSNSLDLSKLNLTAIPTSLVQLANLKTLDLSGNQITAIPDSLAQLTNLQGLDLRGNQIAAIPDSLAQLANLQGLGLESNQITAIPDSLAQLTNLQVLSLSDNRIMAIPDSLAQLTNLQGLGLKGNQITAIPDSLAQLTSLEELDLSSNQITAIPDSLAQLASLEELYLSGNQIIAIPDSLAQLTNLQRLDLSGNQITAIPYSLAHLANLQVFYLKDNQITAIPDSLAQLANLEFLVLNSNQITAIPDSLAQFANLRVLGLNGNRITAIPDSLAQLTNLEFLYLKNNQITAIPDSLTQLSNLKDLDLKNNPLPAEIFAALARGVPSFIRYLQSTAARKVYPRTVKVVLLGEPQSGKTTLLEALKGNLRPCDESRKETIGVNVVRIEKPHPVDHEPMYLSVWDFAGQHIEHATHQFFLTENAIYLILWNARQGTESGKRDLWYWLELLKMRVRDPKFLLVATHIEHTPPDLNLSEVERSYKGFQGNFPVELENLRGMDQLDEKICKLAADSPSLRAEWPAEWLPVRDEIRKIRQQQPHMTPAAFRSLMKENRVTGQVAQNDLAGQLHNLGEILYFQERDELSSLVILNPEWVTELIALVVRSKEVRENKGILSKADLGKLWKRAKLQPKVRDHLIHLMDWFDLTYSTGHQTDLGIVVEALPYSTPESLQQIDLRGDQPRMEMIFRFPSLQRHLPPGIPTWGIARAHRFSQCKPWRDAAVFEDKETKSQALISASDSTKEIRLLVAADYPPFFFGLLESILRDTFRRYPGLEPERRLPCSCKPTCTATYLYETVLKRWHDRKAYVTCDQSGEDVTIESLLTGARCPETEEGFHALHSEMRRRFTEQLRAQREQMEKTCPSVFTLIPSGEFKQLDTWLESRTQEEELELTLYCEHDSGWHATSHSLYRFRLDQEWFGILKGKWNKLVGVTKRVGPLAKGVGKATGTPWGEIADFALDKLPEVSRSAAGPLSRELGEKEKPEFIDIETRYLLEQLIDHLDSLQRSAIEPKRGGLRPYIVEDGRLLWLCAEHLKEYKKR
jgi:internalin A